MRRHTQSKCLTHKEPALRYNWGWFVVLSRSLVLINPRILRLLLVLTLSALAPSYLTTDTVRGSPAGEIVWSQTSNPSGDSEEAYSVAVDGTGV
jgi:hypothetical protein